MLSYGNAQERDTFPVYDCHYCLQSHVIDVIQIRIEYLLKVNSAVYSVPCEGGGVGGGGGWGVELPWATNQPSLTFTSTVTSSPTCNSKSLSLFPLNAVTTLTLCSAVVIFCFARFFSFIRFLRTRSRCERKRAVIVHTLSTP